MLQQLKSDTSVIDTGSYEQILKAAAAVFEEPRLVLMDAHDAIYQDSFYSRVCAISHDLTSCLATLNREIQYRADLSASVGFRLNFNPCVEYYYANKRLIVVLIHYIFVFRYDPTAVAGGVLYRRGYVAIQNNIRGESNLPAGLFNMGSLYVVVDPWGVDFAPTNPIAPFKPFDFFGIPTKNRMADLHIGAIATAISKGRGNYQMFSNDGLDLYDYVNVDYNVNVVPFSSTEPVKMYSSQLRTNIASSVGVDYKIRLTYKVLVDISFFQTDSSDEKRWFGCQRFQTTLDKDSLDGSDSGAAVERSSHWYAFNDGKIFSPTELEPIPEPCARNFSKQSIFEDNNFKPLEKDKIRSNVAHLINADPESKDIMRSFDYGHDNTYFSSAVALPCDIKMAPRNVGVLDYSVYKDANGVVPDYGRIKFEDQISLDMSISCPVGSIPPKNNSEIVIKSDSIINVVRNVKSDSGRITFNSFSIMGGVNFGNMSENAVASASFKPKLAAGLKSIVVGTDNVIVDGIMLPLKEVSLKAGHDYGNNKEKLAEHRKLLNDLVLLNWPVAVRERHVSIPLCYWTVRLPFSQISHDLKGNANIMLSRINNADVNNENFSQQLLRIKPNGSINVTRKDGGNK